MHNQVNQSINTIETIQTNETTLHENLIVDVEGRKTMASSSSAISSSNSELIADEKKKPIDKTDDHEKHIFNARRWLRDSIASEPPNACVLFIFAFQFLKYSFTQLFLPFSL